MNAPNPSQSMLDDPRVDPRIKSVFAAYPRSTAAPSVASRETLLEAERSQAGQAARAATKAWMSRICREDIAPEDGLISRTFSVVSRPDDNEIKVLFIRPPGAEPLACVYYIHGGGMMSMSCFDAWYATWGRLLAAEGVAVAMPDFRNCLAPSSTAEVAPFPAGLNDCVSALEWLIDNADDLGVDRARIVVSGESGGGNLTLATGIRLAREGRANLIKGIYALCPILSGQWPQTRYPSSTENNGYWLDLHNNRNAMAYGIEAFEARDPLAWPAFASEADVAGFPPTVISVSECDPLRDEGIEFYRLLLRAGAPARCRQVMGAIHGAELFTAWCPDISRDATRDIAALARG
jgi:acetyl esterase/lipase